jgi:hypothetical protein
VTSYPDTVTNPVDPPTMSGTLITTPGLPPMRGTGETVVDCPNPTCKDGDVSGGAKGLLLCPDCHGHGKVRR